MINPGSRPIEGATAAQAETNMRAFTDTVRAEADIARQVRPVATVGEPARDQALDADGRYGWILPIGEHRVSILMPGVDLAVVRALNAATPCLQVNGEWVWWHSAAGMAIPATRPYILGGQVMGS
ncbi:hypothetical protein ACIA5D_51475 [Actinoplanes sp. NPDC051513]|uniref:hypothetical protein n=1 Tax=Actinoplanes sp. NPDC051513 TaxID=3363908 RepID=UPI00379E3AE1